MNEKLHVTQPRHRRTGGHPSRMYTRKREGNVPFGAGGVRPSGPGRDCGPDCRLCGSRRMHGRRAVSKETTVVPPKTSLPAPGERTAAEHDRRPPPAVAYVSGESRWARHGGLQATKQKALQRRKEGFPGGGGPSSFSAFLRYVYNSRVVFYRLFSLYKTLCPLPAGRQCARIHRAREHILA